MTRPDMNPPVEDERGAPESPLVQLAHFSGHGLTIALSTGLFLMGGWWLDGKVGSRPLFTIVGALTGAGAGFYSVVQHLVLLPRERARKDAEDATRDPEQER